MRSGRDWTLAWRGAGIRPNSSTAQGWGDASLGSAPCRLLRACREPGPMKPPGWASVTSSVKQEQESSALLGLRQG